MTKSQQVQQHIANKNYFEALRIVAKYRNSWAGADIDKIKLAYDILQHPNFYKQIQKNPEQDVQNGINELIKFYSI